MSGPKDTKGGDVPEQVEALDSVNNGFDSPAPTIFSRRDALRIGAALGLTSLGGGAFWGLLEAMVAKVLLPSGTRVCAATVGLAVVSRWA